MVDKYWDTIVSLTKPSGKARRAAEVKPPISVDKTAISVETLPKTTAPALTLEPSKKTAIIRSAPQPSSVTSLTKQATGNTDRVAALFKSGDYVAALSLITEMLETPLNVTDRDQLTTYLLWANIKNNDTQQALSFADNNECGDGYFYFLAGELQYNRNILEKAENNFKKARSLPSHFDKSIPKKSSLFLAKIRDGLYMMKPNVDNKQLCVRAWSTFIDMYCTGDESQECADANERLSSLVAKTQ